MEVYYDLRDLAEGFPRMTCRNMKKLAEDGTFPPLIHWNGQRAQVRADDWDAWWARFQEEGVPPAWPLKRKRKRAGGGR